LVTSNKLIHEKSPYLLQHARNPVHWYPWGEEAFHLAKQLDKPIFLSIGYATCHWCHVMERESFCDQAIAALLNKTFICIKVDREELPEVDNLYMEFAQALMSTGGGWPLNVILTPDLKPFYAMTYLPPINSQGMMGLKETTERIQELWNSQDRHHILIQADQVVDLFKEAVIVQGENIPTIQDVSLGVEALLSMADTAYGGRRGSPKFPLSYQLEFLMQYAQLKEDPRSLFFSQLTLEMMQRGGIYDHLGGGFSRYSIDDKWLIPHFEKMLCDNAILAKTYIEGYKLTKEMAFKIVACETLDYILREMAHPKGGFYSAQDADSKGEEGLFYTWTLVEVESILNTQEHSLFIEYFNMTAEGNFEGRNVLYKSQTLEEFAEMKGIHVKELQEILISAKVKLMQARNQREHPFKDDKILTSWNALAIESFVQAGIAFSKEQYIEAAIKSVQFLKKELYLNKKLLRRYRDQEAKFDANLEDYAYLIHALIVLFEYGYGLEYLTWAVELTQTLTKEFKAEEGAFYFSSEQKQDLLIRKCEFNDGSEPCGNSIHAENLLKLYHITGDVNYRLQAEDIFKAGMYIATEYPQGCASYLKALLVYLNKKACTLIIALDEKRSLENPLKEFFASEYLPYLTVIWKGINEDFLCDYLPYLKEKTTIDGQTALYLCTQEQCFPPILKIEDLKKTISSL
jgi:uncharacterized protein YyaL (SSP411 family)